MFISAKCDYACRAILELSHYWPQTMPVTVDEIHKRTNVPLKYLIQILIQLKNAKYVVSIRGKGGGYILARSPEQISLADIIQIVGEPIISNTVNSRKKKAPVLMDVWLELEKTVNDFLCSKNFKKIKAYNLKATKHCNYYI